MSNHIVFNDSRTFCPAPALEGYLAPELGQKRQSGKIKVNRHDFQVSELIPETGRYLTVGRESDFPSEALVFENPHQRQRVWASMVKHGLSSYAAPDWLHNHLAEQLRRPHGSFSVKVTGLKDRRAETVQLIEIDGCSPAELQRLTWPLTPEVELKGKVGFYLKDIRPALRPLHNGAHRINHFQIRVDLAGQSRDEITAYLLPRLERLRMLGGWIPNFYGNQRLGGRQISHLVGQTGIAGGPYKTEKKDEPFSSNVEAAMHRFVCEASPAENPTVGDIRRQCRSFWLYRFDKMAELLERTYTTWNLGIEFKMASRLASDQYNGDFNAVFASMKDETSLWVAAWQSYWWNQVLFHNLPDWTCQMEARNGFDPNKVWLPSLMDTPRSREFYSRLDFCQTALWELDQAEPVVHDMFLIPQLRRGHDNQEYRPREAPSRRAFIQVEGLDFQIRNGEVIFTFDLISGAYATTFLSLLWNLNDESEAEGGRNIAAELAEATGRPFHNHRRGGRGGNQRHNNNRRR